MRNCSEEFKTHVGDKKIKCAVVRLYLKNEDYVPKEKRKTHEFFLRTGHSLQELYSFLDKMNIEYDGGFGTQYLFGTIWYQDGTWSERGEYDGSEWWEFRRCPEIYEELIG